MKKLVTAFVVLTLLGLLLAGGLVLYLERAVDRPGQQEGTVVFTVPRGMHAIAVGHQLTMEGFAGDELAWRYLIKSRGGLELKAGRFKLDRSASMRQLADSLELSPMPEDVAFKVLEGWRLRDTDDALAARGWIAPGDYIRRASTARGFRAPFVPASTTLEGYLYPETYLVVPDRFKLETFIQRQLDTFASRFFNPHEKEIAESGRSLHDLVTMASMLEREEPTPAQRPLVAGILWKRIDHDTALGVDATSRYELEQWNDRASFLKRLRDKDDPYNSRFRKGLPPTPIGAPTVESMLAALRPEESPYWYYLHDSNKVLHPSRNAKEHEALREKHNVY